MSCEYNYATVDLAHNGVTIPGLVINGPLPNPRCCSSRDTLCEDCARIALTANYRRRVEARQQERVDREVEQILGFVRNYRHEHEPATVVKAERRERQTDLLIPPSTLNVAAPPAQAGCGCRKKAPAVNAHHEHDNDDDALALPVCDWAEWSRQ